MNKKFDPLLNIFFSDFTHKESECDIHIDNVYYKQLISDGLVYNAGNSASDRIVIRLTNKGKKLIK